MDTSFTESPDHTESPADEDTFADTRRNLLDDFACPTPMKASNVEPGEEHMKVFLRIRPFTEEEENTGEKQDCVELENENLLTMHAPKDSVTFKNSAHGCGKTTHKFTFSKIFPEDTTQKLFFDESMLSTVKDFVEGQNCLVFTYGITNAGKTYTIQGNPKDGGILPRTLDVLFNSIDNRQWENMTLKPKMFCDVIKLNEKDIENEMKIKEKVFRMATDEEPDVTTLLGDDASDMSKLTNTTVASEESIVHASSIEGGLDDLDDAENRIREEMAINVAAQGQIKFSVWISFAEIYNEYIYDLLEPLPKKKNARRQVLSLREDKNGSPYIKGLKHIHVTSADEAYKVLTIGKKNLQFACTKLNQSSSRSHCIFNIKVLRVVDKENPNMCRMSMLSLVDLAGSERCTKTQNTGDRLKEAGNINTSLLTLGRCISTLRYNQLHKENSKIIPFRESKLTRLFQSYFCGKGRACMIVNVNQLASAFDETLHVLKFSAIAKQVIVQKEEPKPKKSALRSAARFVSLALAHNPGGARPSISWASPGTMDLPQMEHAMNLPIPEGDESELIELENEREEELLAIITGLKEEILAERRKQATLEVQIREEVCQEMAQQLVEIENQYSERLREGYQAAEEKADRRIDMYTQSVKASRKRARIQRFEDEEDEWVSSVLLHAEQTKVKELENKLEEQKDLLRTVEADLEHAQSSLKEAMNKRNSLQEEKSKSEFQMASDMSEMKKSHEKALLELQAKLNELETNMTPENEAEQLPSKKPEGSDDMSKFVHDEIINNLTQQLKDAKETIATQASQISELNEMLTEAGETFEEKNQEIEKLKNTVSEDEERLQQQVTALEDLQKLVSESKQALVEAERKLAERDHTLVELRQHIDVQKECVDDKLQENLALEEEISGLKDSVAELNTSLKAAQELAAKMKEDSSIRQQEQAEVDNGQSAVVHELQDQNKTVTSALDEEKLNHGVTRNLLTSLESESKELEKELNERKAAMAKSDQSAKLSEEELTELKNKLRQAESESRTLQETMHELENETCLAQENLEKEKTALTAIEDKLQEECAAKKEAEEKLEKLKMELMSIKDALEKECSSRKTADEQTESVQVQLSVTETKIKNLEEEKSALSLQLDSLTNRAEDMSFQVNEYRIEMEHMAGSSSAKEVEKELREELASLKAQLQKEQQKFHTARVEVSTLENNVEQLEHDLKVKSEKVKNLETRLSSTDDEKQDIATSPVHVDEEDEIVFSNSVAGNAEIDMTNEIKDLKQTLEKERQKLRAARIEVSSLENALQQRDHDLTVTRDRQVVDKKCRVSGAAQTEDALLGMERPCQVSGSVQTDDVLVGRLSSAGKHRASNVSDEDMDIIFNTNADLLGSKHKKDEVVCTNDDKSGNLESEGIAQLEQEISALKEKLSSLTQQNADLEKNMANTQTTFVKRIADLEKCLADSQTETVLLKQHKCPVQHREEPLKSECSSQEEEDIDMMFEKNSEILTPGKQRVTRSKKINVKSLNTPKKDGRMRKELAAKEEEIKTLKDQLSSLSAEKSDPEKHVSLEETFSERKHQVIVEECNAEITALAHALKTAENSHEVAEKRASDLENRLKQIESELETAKIKCVYLESQAIKQTAEGSSSVVETLSKQVSELENVISVDKLLCNEAKERILSVETECEQLQEQVVSLEMEKCCVEAQLKEVASGKCCEVYRSKVEELEQCSTQLRTMLDETTNQVKRLNVENAEKAKKIVALSEEVSSGNENCRQLKEEELSAMAQKCTGLEDEVRMKDLLLEQQQVQVLSLETRLADARVDAATARQTENKKEGCVREYEEQLAACQTQLEELKEEISNVTEREGKLEEAREVLTKELKESGEKLDKMTVICETLNVAKSEADHELRELKSKCTGLEADNKESLAKEEVLLREKSEVEQKLSDLVAKSAGLQEDKQKLMDSMGADDELKIKCDGLQSELKEKKEEVERLSEDIEEVKGSKVELKSKCDELEEEIKEKDASLKTLQNDVDELKDNTVELKTKCKEKDVCLENLQEEVKNLRTQNQEEMDKLVAKNELVSDELRSLESTSALLKAEKAALVTEVDLMKCEVKRLTGNLDKVDSSKAETGEEMVQLRAECTGMTEKIDNLEKEVVRMKAEIEQKEMKMAELSNQLCSMRLSQKQMASLTENLNKAQEREDDLRRKLREASVVMDEQNKEYKLLQEKIMAANDAVVIGDVTKKKLNHELNDYKKMADDYRSTLEEVKSQLREKDLRHQGELESAEDKLSSKERQVTQLLSEIEMERKQFEIALKDSTSNEKLIEDLKKAMEEQEDCMEKQDQRLAELEQANSADKENYDKLLQEKEKLGTLLSQKTTEIKELEENRSESQDAEYQKILADKQSLETIVSENNNELKELEKILSGTRHELETLKANQEGMLKKKLAASKEDMHSQITNLKQEVIDKKADIRHLKKENEEKSRQIRETEVKIETLQQKMSEMDSKKEAELQEWRESRDQLVSSLEKVMAKKDEENKELKGQLSSGRGKQATDSEEKKEHEQLVKMLEEKVASLEEILSQTLENNQTRGSRRTRGRQTALGSTGSDKGGNATEASEYKQQLDREKLDHKETCEKLERVLVARDENEADLREANQRLQSQLMAMQEGSEATEKKVARARKRRSHEMATMENAEPVPTPTRSTRGRRKKVKEEPVAEEEEVENLQRNSSQRASKRALAKIGEMVQNSAKSAKKFIDSVKSPTRSPLSPSVSESQVAPPTTGKKKRLFNKDAPAVYSAPPPFDLAPAEPENAHTTVMRRLTRNRKK